MPKIVHHTIVSNVGKRQQWVCTCGERGKVVSLASVAKRGARGHYDGATK